MSRVCIISDIHGNTEALDMVLKEACCDSLWCLGDIVGVDEGSVRCADIVKEKSDIAIQGNHEIWMLREVRDGLCGYELKPDVMEYIKGLPREKVLDGVRLTHGSPADPEKCVVFVNNTFALRKAFQAFEEKLCFIGHTHNPKGYLLTEDGRVFSGSPGATKTRLMLESECRYLVNVGSVGILEWTGPCFVIYDTDENIITWHMFIDGAYDNEATPEPLAMTEITLL